jgi:hypothetical protein
MRATPPFRIFMALALVALLAGCRGAAEDVAQADAPAAGEPVATASERDEVQDAPRSESDATIYHDLTAFEWYRQGQPLRHGAQAYQPVGRPTAVPPEELRQAGTYEGVDYYVHQSEPEPPRTLYIRVFDRYWQPFQAGSGNRNAD